MLDPKLRWRRNPTVVHRQVGSDAFLVDPQSDALFHLNPLGGALWHLLEAPVSANSAAVIVAEAFPEIASDQVRVDTLALFGELAMCNLIISVEEP